MAQSTQACNSILILVENGNTIVNHIEDIIFLLEQQLKRATETGNDEEALEICQQFETELRAVMTTYNAIIQFKPHCVLMNLPTICCTCRRAADLIETIRLANISFYTSNTNIAGDIQSA